MNADEMARELASLGRRVAALEATARPPAVPAMLDQHLDADTVLYAGLGGWDGQTLAWQVVRGWDEIRSAPADASAGVLAALANPTRVRIATELLRRRLTTAELAQRLDQPSPGQLFHHLKELLAAGVVHQPERGTYAVREQHVIPLLSVLCAVLDLRPSVPWEDS
ncbi:ArsR/SmtB family transcription factor [Paractinoplanes rishiriensis]|uniref:Transcriptional regulator n=1 Tax=Paractinoplanes rishiriensis TaxID=1050105 RepID=A0A919MUU6_9ACTN|nr:helix-turn-helix domain-containing protein [Actinoplanes rishiriensis]GIF00702.1 transcriptional regulator [Actinoplanes rishiriensis]